MRFLLAIISFVMLSFSVKAQIADGAFYLNWSVVKPTYTELIDKSSTRGMRLGFSRFLSDRFGFGIEGSYSILDDYVPRQTYEFPGGAITTDIYNYMYYFTAAANGQYYFKTSGLLIPYGSMAAGVALTEYTLFYNAYSNSDNNVRFMMRPEIGLMYRFSNYSSFGLKTSVSYDYALNNSEYFNLENFSGVSFQVGIMLYNH